MLMSRLTPGLTLTSPHGVDTAHEARATLSAATINNINLLFIVIMVLVLVLEEAAVEE